MQLIFVSLKSRGKEAPNQIFEQFAGVQKPLGVTFQFSHFRSVPNLPFYFFSPPPGKSSNFQHFRYYTQQFVIGGRKKGGTAQLERVPLVFWDRNCVHPKGLSLMPKEINCPKSLLGCEKVGNEIIMQIYSLGVTFSSRHVNKCLEGNLLQF